MKILVLTSKFGMGHFSAAQTLTKQIQTTFPHNQVILADLFEIAFPQHSEVVYNTYAKLVQKGSKIIKSTYKNNVNDDQGLPKSLNILKQFMLTRVDAYLTDTAPDLIISTHSLAARLVSDYKKSSGSSCPLVTCITDVGIHNIWLNPNTLLYLTACQETKDALKKHGILDENIAISGIPVGNSFNLNRKTSRNDHVKELLIMGGGLGMLPESKAFYQKISKIPQLHITVICGKNNKLRQKLISCDPKRIKVLGCCNDVARYMANADMLLSKPGGITTFEAVQMDLPLLLFRPKLEQEIKNCDFILEKGLGKVLSGKNDSYAQEIAAYIYNERHLAKIQENMHSLRTSFDDTALLRLISQVENRLNERERRAG